MTTPEQLRAWREQFEAKLTNTHIGTVTKYGKQVYFDSELEQYWQGYLRRCQEVEQWLGLG